jgi:hypothetical protein
MFTKMKSSCGLGKTNSTSSGLWCEVFVYNILLYSSVVGIESILP